ncbi:MAG: acylphosphatase [Bacteroidales bacterium]|nr:acylphosphatase [Bacteroidales bacterium]
MMKCNKKIVIHGNIRNESFMFSALQKAALYGLTGFIKSKSKGIIFIEAEGTAEQINLLIEWCRKGTVWSDVSDVQVVKGDVKNHKEFVIKKTSIFQVFAL